MAGRIPRVYTCQVRRSQRWVEPGIELRSTYRGAVKYLTEYGEQTAAEAIRLTVDGRIAAEAVRTKVSNGTWQWIRGGWSWSE